MEVIIFLTALIGLVVGVIYYIEEDEPRPLLFTICLVVAEFVILKICYANPKVEYINIKSDTYKNVKFNKVVDITEETTTYPFCLAEKKVVKVEY